MLHWLGNVVALLVQHLEDFIGVEQSLHFALLYLLLLLVPVPFVNLARF